MEGIAVMRYDAILVLLLTLTTGCRHSTSPAAQETDTYLYADTRQLVEFVESAANLIEQRGAAAAFREFDRPDSIWRTNPTYLFVYDPHGRNVWHGLEPSLVGRDLSLFRDPLGKPVVQRIVDVGRRPERNARDWVFYLWEEQTDIQPVWKGSYIRKAVAPDGQIYLVGSGSSRLKVEKVFAQRKVDAAAKLLQQQGSEFAFQQLRDPSSEFN